MKRMTSRQRILLGCVAMALEMVGVMNSISARTIWRTFDSCNNYRMPERVHSDCSRVEYWVAEAERNANVRFTG